MTLFCFFRQNRDSSFCVWWFLYLLLVGRWWLGYGIVLNPFSVTDVRLCACQIYSYNICPKLNCWTPLLPIKLLSLSHRSKITSQTRSTSHRLLIKQIKGQTDVKFQGSKLQRVLCFLNNTELSLNVNKDDIDFSLCLKPDFGLNGFETQKNRILIRNMSMCL